MENNVMKGMLVSCIYSKKNNRSYLSILLESDQTSFFKGLETYRESFEGDSVFKKFKTDHVLQEVDITYDYVRSSFGRDMVMKIRNISIAETGEVIL